MVVHVRNGSRSMRQLLTPACYLLGSGTIDDDIERRIPTSGPHAPQAPRTRVLAKPCPYNCYPKIFTHAPSAHRTLPISLSSRPRRRPRRAERACLLPPAAAPPVDVAVLRAGPAALLPRRRHARPGRGGPGGRIRGAAAAQCARAGAVLQVGGLGMCRVLWWWGWCGLVGSSNGVKRRRVLPLGVCLGCMSCTAGRGRMGAQAGRVEGQQGRVVSQRRLARGFAGT